MQLLNLRGDLFMRLSMNKTQKIFLIIGLILITATTVLISIEQYNDTLQRYMRELQHPSKFGFWPWEIANIILVKLIIILFEISLIKNIYTLLATNQRENRKLLCGISLAILFLSFCLFYMSLSATYNFNTGLSDLRYDFLNYSWLLLIISFILGFIKPKKRDTNSEE